MRIRLRLCGHTILSITFENRDATEYYESETDCSVGGGSTHNFERSIDYYYTEPEERGGFGFR